MPELTGPQIVTQQQLLRSNATDKLTYQVLRKMRRDPTIALVRFMFFAGIYASAWSYEKMSSSVPDSYVEFVKRVFKPLRRHFLATSALGCFDFGWQPYEKIIVPDLKSTSQVLTKLKPLLQDVTLLTTDKDTGAFTGFTQNNATITLDKALLCAFDVEGTTWEGNSTLANSKSTWDATQALNEVAKRYDEKAAGAHWVVRYPQGSSPYNGVETPNDTIAQAILKSLQASGMVAIPIGLNAFQGLPTDAKGGWDIELVTASSSAVDFNARMEYLDRLKARASGFPERAVLEGHFGTKAEASAHQDFVITLIEYRHACLLETLNWHCVNQLLTLNFGEDAENAVAIVPSPLSEESKGLLQTVYDKILSSPEGMMNELDALDISAIAEALGLPRNSDERALA